MILQPLANIIPAIITQHSIVQQQPIKTKWH